VKKDKTCAPYVRSYEQSHLFRINVAWLLTLLPYQILLGVLGVFISHVLNFVTSVLFSKSAAIILKTIVNNFLHMHSNEICHLKNCNIIYGFTSNMRRRQDPPKLHKFARFAFFIPVMRISLSFFFFFS
jgi:hypothetical protein